jgi:hypothetical protein
MLFFHRLMYIQTIGVMTSTATVAFKLQCSDTSAFTIANDLVGKGITTLNQSDTSPNNRIVKVGVQSEDLSSSTFSTAGVQQRYVRSVQVVGTAACLVHIIALASAGRWKAEAGVAGAAGVAGGKEITNVVQTISDAT